MTKEKENKEEKKEEQEMRKSSCLSLPLVVSPGAGGSTGAPRTPTQLVIHHLPQALRRHLGPHNTHTHTVKNPIFQTRPKLNNTVRTMQFEPLEHFDFLHALFASRSG